MSHLKRQEAPKTWPITRKGTKFVVKPNFSTSKGIPIVMLIRDMLELAQNKREVKDALNKKYILLNGKEARDEKNPAMLFDTLTIIPSKEHYRLELSEKGKFRLEKIKENEVGKKIAKIIDKKILRGGKTQLNLSDGRNFISELKCGVNDSVLINLKEKKIEKCLPLRENAKVIIFEGKHIGKRGTINRISRESKMAEVDISGNKINILIRQLIVAEG